MTHDQKPVDSILTQLEAICGDVNNMDIETIRVIYHSLLQDIVKLQKIIYEKQKTC